MSITKQVVTRTALLAVVAALGISIAAPVVAQAEPRRLTNQDRSVTSTEVKRALQNTSGVLETSTNTKASADVDSALVTATAGATVDVPKDARRGVRLAGKDGSSLSVGLPNAGSASTATQVANGVVSYPSSNGSANAVQTNADGSVRMLTVIDNPNAPTRYDYRLTLPVGSSITLTTDGGAKVIDANQEVLATVPAPWAKDANGRPIRTWFVTNGATLTQVVKHRVAGIAYPVTADPVWISAAVFWWAVRQCAAGAVIGLVVKYIEGDRSRRAMTAAAAAGCLGNIFGSWGIVKHMIKIYR